MKKLPIVLWLQTSTIPPTSPEGSPHSDHLNACRNVARVLTTAISPRWTMDSFKPVQDTERGAMEKSWWDELEQLYRPGMGFLGSSTCIWKCVSTGLPLPHSTMLHRPEYMVEQ